MNISVQYLDKLLRMCHNDNVASDTQEKNMDEGTEKLWGTLIDEIRSQMEHKGMWEEVDDKSNMREIQLFGYDCRIAALSELGIKMFGVSKSKIMDCARGKDATPPDLSNS